ncbi:MAG: aspartate dehydrogenase [Bacillus sp. (in: firmicutes)]
MVKVGLIGFGAIGKDVAAYINEKKAGEATLAAILVRNKQKYADLDQTPLFFDKEEEFFNKDLDIIIENAGHQAVYQYAEKSLSSGSDFLVVSIGAFSNQEFFQRVKEAAKQNKQKLIIPSAAIGGLDRLSAAAVNGLEKVTLLTKKPPKAWKGTPSEQMVDLDSLIEPFLLFEGNAKESAQLFPESTNVSAAVGIAGLGLEQTKVQVYVDPFIQNNTHQIIAEGYFGKMEINIQNRPSEDNPKTGYIVAMSICKVLKNLTSPLIIGI